jgi:hypothetical protein
VRPSGCTGSSILGENPHVVLVKEIYVKSLFDSSLLVRVAELDSVAKSQLGGVGVRSSDCRT